MLWIKDVVIIQRHDLTIARPRHYIDAYTETKALSSHKDEVQ